MQFLEINKNDNEKKLRKLLEKNLFENTLRENKHTTDISLAIFDIDSFIGGLTANIEFETCSLNLLAIDKRYRRKKLGSQLISLLEIKMKEKDIEHIILSTQAYEAKDFYLKNGFYVIGEIKDVPFKGTIRYYMRKDI